MTQYPQAFQRTGVIQADETAVTHDVGVHHGDQLSPIWRSSG
jgi:hypothetical protein